MSRWWEKKKKKSSEMYKDKETDRSTGMETKTKWNTSPGRGSIYRKFHGGHDDPVH